MRFQKQWSEKLEYLKRVSEVKTAHNKNSGTVKNSKLTHVELYGNDYKVTISLYHIIAQEM